MARLTRSFDWSGTSLGNPSHWPIQLKQLTGTVLNTPTPMLICWGDQLIQLYNDSFRPILGELKHPRALGIPVYDTYSEVWPTLQPLFTKVLQGESVAFQEFKLTVNRNGYAEDTYFDFSYSPITDEMMNVLGVLTICTETTQKVIAAQSEARFKSLVESSEIMISINDLEGNVEYINQAWLNLLDRTSDEMLKYDWGDFLHPDDKEALLAEFVYGINSQKSFTVEFRMMTKENEARWIYTRVNPRTHTDGTYAGTISSSIDITDRKLSQDDMASLNEELNAANEEQVAVNEELLAAQEELRNLNTDLLASGSRLQSILQQATAGIMILNGRDLIVESVNEEMLSIISKAADCVGKRFQDVLPELSSQGLFEVIDQVYVTGVTFLANEAKVSVERNGLLVDGYFNFSYQTIVDEANCSSGILIVATDVTAQVVNRLLIEQAEENLRLAIQAGDMGTFSLGTETLSLYTSPRVKELWGFKPNEAMPLEAIIGQVREDYRPQVSAMVEAAISRGEKFELEYPIVCHDSGKERWIKSTGSTVVNTADKESCFTGTLLDITDRKRDDERKNDFIGMVSHELKTPLTSLNAHIQMLQGRAKKADDSFALNSLGTAVKQVKKMTKMINGFLNVSRLESSKIHIEHQRFDMKELVKDVEDEIIPTVTTHKIIFDPVLTTWVNGDRDKLGQVITNYISNALKYSPPDTTVQIACVAADGCSKVSVRDEGMGIADKDIDKLFDRYYRVEGHHMPTVSGFGIGLYLCKEIIDRHNGKVWVESEVGKGSTFYFSIPTTN